MISITLSNTGVYRVVARSWNSLSNGEYQMRLTSLEPEKLCSKSTVHVSSTFSGSYQGVMRWMARRIQDGPQNMTK